MKAFRNLIAEWPRFAKGAKFLILFLYLLMLIQVWAEQYMVAWLTGCLIICFWVTEAFRLSCQDWQEIADKAISTAHELLSQREEWTRLHRSSIPKR